MIRKLAFTALLMSVAFSLAAQERSYIVNGQVRMCEKGKDGFDYQAFTDVSFEPEEGFICSATPYHAKQEVRAMYESYGIVIKKIKATYAIDLNGVRKPQNAGGFT